MTKAHMWNKIICKSKGEMAYGILFRLQAFPEDFQLIIKIGKRFCFDIMS